MAGTVTPNLADISLCEIIGDWTAVGGNLTVTDNTIFGPAQGTYNLQNLLNSGGNRGADWTWTSDQDFQDTVIYAWFAFSNKNILQNKGSTGLRIRITDVNGYWGEWDIAGKDTLPHAGWICHAVRTNQAYSRTGGTNPVRSQIRKVGWRADTVTAKGTIYFDAWRKGTGLTIEGGTGGDPAKFEDFITAEETQVNRWGVISKYEGVYFVQGKLLIGKSGQTSPTVFKDTSKVIIFKDVVVGDDFYEITLNGASNPNQTTFELGSVVGSGDNRQGVSGGSVRTVTRNWKLDAKTNIANLASVKLYGVDASGAGRGVLLDDGTKTSVISCSFVNCGEIDPGTISNGAEILSVAVIDPDDYGLMWPNTTHNVKKVSFITSGVPATQHMCHFTQNADYSISWDGIKFFGSYASATLWHGINTGNGADITINCVSGSGSNPTGSEFENTGIPNGTVTVNNPVTYTISNLKADSEVRIYRTSDGQYLAGVESSGTTFQYNYTYGGSDVPVYVHVIKEDYEWIRYNDTLEAANKTTKVFQRFDRNYSNP